MEKINLNNYLKSICDVDEPGLTLILSQMTRQAHYQKNNIIYKKGETPKHLSFIETGNAIALSQSSANRQVLRIWTTNQLICPPGFFSHESCNQNIIALDDCQISKLTYNTLYRFLNDFPQAYSILNSILRIEIAATELNIKSISQNNYSNNLDALLDALSIKIEG
ncbi:MAG: cyclic nucleotide-binding domain-containing protein [Pedobacter sp.]|nr:MAG: cyclic nucleotide-binding domain-containing protein [Pedobacter sp.]